MIIVPASSSALDLALKLLQSGAIVAHATETCYGLACDLTNPAAVKKLFRIKKRASDQPVSALFPSIEEAKKYVEWNDEAETLAKEFLPGPLTLILPLRNDAPFSLSIRANSQKLTLRLRSGRVAKSPLAIRISSHPLAISLALRFGKPISTTSANLHGLPATYSAEEIVAQFHGQSAQPDLIIDSGKLPGNKPSRIVDLVEKEMKILRK